MSEVDWLLSYPIWYADEHSVPYDIMNAPELSPLHWKRIQEADLQFPLHVLKWKGRLLVLDGVHRMARAKLEGLQKIKVKILTKDHVPLILPDEEDFHHGFLKEMRDRSKR